MVYKVRVEARVRHLCKGRMESKSSLGAELFWVRD